MVMRVRTRIGPSPIHGLGLFAVDPIPRGTTVWEWDEGVDLRLPLGARDAATGPLRELLDTHAWVGEGALWLPADGARHVNHSATPNCGAGPAAAPSVALRDIGGGEEITEDYGRWDEEWRARPPLTSPDPSPGLSIGLSSESGRHLLTQEAEDWRALALGAGAAATECLKQLGAAEARLTARVEELEREHAARIQSLEAQLEVAQAWGDVAVRERDAARIRAQALGLELEGLRARLQGESPSEAALAAMARLALTGSRA